jgi:hypothetical protein
MRPEAHLEGVEPRAGWQIAVLVLALTLLVPQVVANDHDPTVPADHLALVTDLLDAGLYLHDC